MTTMQRPTDGSGAAGEAGGATGDAGREGRSMESYRASYAAGQRTGVNVGEGERAASVAAGAILAALGVSRRSVPGLIAAGLGGALVYRGVTGHCSVYDAMGMNSTAVSGGGARRTAEIEARGIHVEQSVLVNRPARELYDYWRQLENLPRIMRHLESVTATDACRSHWVAQAPAIAGGTVEWDAEITRDEPGSAIAWRSLPGSEVDTAGEVRFEPALGDRGTRVRVSLSYVPPAGRVGHYAAKLFGKGADQEVREGLRDFKRVMEVGETPTVLGQPRGSCGK